MVKKEKREQSEINKREVWVIRESKRALCVGGNE